MISQTGRRIRTYILTELLEAPPIDDDPLAGGQLDSLALEELVAFIEDEFEIAFEDEELVVEHFMSIAILAGFVDAKRQTEETGIPVPADQRAQTSLSAP